MSVEAKEIEFRGLINIGDTRGKHSRPWSRLVNRLQIEVGGLAPIGGPLSFNLVIDGVVDAQEFSAADGATYADLVVGGDGVTVAPNSILELRATAANGASDATITLIAATKIFGDALFGDAEDAGAAVTITTFLTAEDIANNISASKLIEALDDPVNPTGTLDTVKRDGLITRVNGEMWSAIARRNKRPLVVSNDTVNEILGTCGGFALDLFWYYAIADKSHILEAFKGVAKKFDDARAWLDDIANGKRTLGTSRAVPGAEARTDAIQTGTHEGTFSRDRLKRW